MPPLIPTPRRELLATGVTDHELRLDLRAGRTVQVFRGVHVAAGHEAGLMQRVFAAVKTQRHAVSTYTTSAALHGFRWIPEAWTDPGATVHVAVDADAASRHRTGLRLHRRLIEPEDVVLLQGIPCFTAERTLVELARSRDIPCLLAVQIIDGALRDERVTKAELEECLRRFPGERGIARARDVVRRCRAGVDSPRETQLRLMLEDGHLPELDVPLEIRDDSDGTVLARGDLGYWRFLIWGEYDGFDAHTRRQTFRTDRVGDRWLRQRGWHVMRFVDADFDRPGTVCREMERAIADAPARIAALPPGRSRELDAARRMLGLGR